MTEPSVSRTPVTAARVIATLVAAVMAALVVVAALIGGVYFLVRSTGNVMAQYCEERNDCSDVGW